jgi:hypothetical protein
MYFFYTSMFVGFILHIVGEFTPGFGAGLRLGQKFVHKVIDGDIDIGCLQGARGRIPQFPIALAMGISIRKLVSIHFPLSQVMWVLTNLPGVLQYLVVLLLQPNLS